jgi:small subunit ribosomal protein S2
MAPYLFGVRNGIHIIDLQQTVPMLHAAMMAVRGAVAGGGRVLFVGTKRQASETIAESAKRCGQYYVNHRWLGGMMTNWRTISNSIKRLREVEEQIEDENAGLTKKELLRVTRERDKLERALGGIKEMGGLPDILFVIDTNKEAIAVAEATKLGIPVVAVVDSNSDPDDIDFPIPGNDDAIRAVSLYCNLMVGTVLDGIQQEMTAAGVDVGEGEEVTPEKLLSEGKEATEGAPSSSAEEEEKKAAPSQSTAPGDAAAEPPKSKDASPPDSGNVGSEEGQETAQDEKAAAGAGEASTETATEPKAETEAKEEAPK